jgi:hypothetical protein
MGPEHREELQEGRRLRRWRLYQKTVDFMKLRADRRKVAKAGQGVDKRAMLTVPATSSTAGESLSA